MSAGERTSPAAPAASAGPAPAASAGPGPRLRLDEQLCFALYSASRLVTRAYRDDLDALGITYPQYVVLIVLWEGARAGTPAPTVTELGRRLHLDSGTLTPLLRRLEGGGMVRRRRCSVDDRMRRVELTAAGRALEASASEIPARLLCTHPQVDRAQLVALKRQLDALLSGLLDA